MANGLGSATLNFGSAPGSSSATAAVLGQGTISGTSSVEVFMMGIDSTATHNAFEHSLGLIRLNLTSLTAGTGFTIQGTSDLRLTGTFTVRWVWSD